MKQETGSAKGNTLQRLQAEAERERVRKEWAWEHAAEVYKERDLLVRALSMLYPSHLMRHVGHHSGNKKLVVCIHSPAGQMTWTIPEWLIEIGYAHLELTANDWDGHKTAEKHERLASLTVPK